VSPHPKKLKKENKPNSTKLELRGSGHGAAVTTQWSPRQQWKPTGAPLYPCAGRRDRTVKLSDGGKALPRSPAQQSAHLFTALRAKGQGSFPISSHSTRAVNAVTFLIDSATTCFSIEVHTSPHIACFAKQERFTLVLVSASIRMPAKPPTIVAEVFVSFLAPPKSSPIDHSRLCYTIYTGLWI
jgi:hypothetical protein